MKRILALALVASTLFGMPAHAASTVYEAENATISQGVVESNHLGFSGTGFVNYDNVAGSFVEWTVTAANAGASTLTLRYSNGTTTNRPLNIAGSTVDFPSTGTWDSWATISLNVQLQAGTNLIRATATTANGGPNVDYLSVDAAPPPPQTIEAESATWNQCVVETLHTGFTGTGYLNCDNVSGSWVQFTVNSAVAQTTNLNFRYANGTTATRPGDVSVNGTVVATPSFPSTTTWENWAFATVSASLVAGMNTIRLTATTANGLPNVDSITVGGTPPPPTRDWADDMVRSTMQRFTPSTIGGWSYPVALYLLGQYQVYLRTGDPARLAYIKQWADRFAGTKQSFDNLDSMLGGRVYLVLYKETGDPKYRTAAKAIHDRFATYPKTSDSRYPLIGGFWHGTTDSRAGQLWSDGVFMSQPFMAEWGRDAATTQADRDASFNQAADQLIIYASHLQQPNGLMKHAYDEPRDETWSDNTTGLAPEYWCRAIGWFGMATIQILDTIPATHPKRGQLVSIVQNMVRGFKTYQDPPTGRWFQVVDKGSRSDNWTETSCSAMYTYTVDRAIEKGYVDAATYQPVADKGFQGVLGKIRLGSDNLTYLDTISEGTNVGDYSYYINRAQKTNDFHGLGAFLFMFEQMRH